jgi:CheY-like chemotaxis protein
MTNGKKRILVVADEPTITRLLKLNLEQTGDYEVVTENISKAVPAVAEEFQPDLLLLDVMMPGLDGGSLASQLQTSPKLKGVPIVFLTATVTREEVRARHGWVGAISVSGDTVVVGAFFEDSSATGINATRATTAPNIPVQPTSSPAWALAPSLASSATAAAATFWASMACPRSPTACSAPPA